jgi:hypothetical protein
MKCFLTPILPLQKHTVIYPVLAGGSQNWMNSSSPFIKRNCPCSYDLSNYNVTGETKFMWSPFILFT